MATIQMYQFPDLELKFRFHATVANHLMGHDSFVVHAMFCYDGCRAMKENTVLCL